LGDFLKPPALQVVADFVDNLRAFSEQISRLSSFFLPDAAGQVLETEQTSFELAVSQSQEQIVQFTRANEASGFTLAKTSATAFMANMF